MLAPKLDAILPLKIDGSYGLDDLRRTDILMASLSAFFQPETLNKFLVVTPRAEATMVRDYLSRWPALPIEVMPEEDLVPELERFSSLRGWRKQQLVKLASSRALSSEYVVTFDADVFVTRPTGKSTLLPGGRALMQYERRALHPKWWASSARLLSLDESVGDPERGMSITPAILSKSILDSLTAKLSTYRHSWAEVLCRLHRPMHPSNWTPARFRRSKWTEYSLYYLHAAAIGALDEFHVEGGTEQTPQVLLGHEAHPFASWDPSFTFGPENRALFCLVGSKSGLDPTEVWEVVADYITPKEAIS